MIVAGMGFRADATLNSLRSALALACGTHRPDLIATAAGKENHDALRALVAELQVPLHAVPQATLAAQSTPTLSPAAQAARNTGSVAEAAALAAAGSGAHLLAPRHISTDRMATCAVAKGTLT
ncbi:MULTISPECIES: cobalamin biosynthesis protein [Roseobacteraceae]|jgi:cobalt-precorrin 5A hydrolase|uniref:Cobalamin biosynthesis protein CbiG n=1 Tax=Pseudosulfitobacter pseudonitzschiae TaxID=1402135 RepID=A0A221K3L3_9RHOB|nr:MULTISPECIES: cobalamin biosynthesis protein [Roseobacteraceae]ASM73586.1 cobalamin biosynthesis protein CbiG [Pseudosulfitobacter pseudonitzschiae]